MRPSYGRASGGIAAGNRIGVEHPVTPSECRRSAPAQADYAAAFRDRARRVVRCLPEPVARLYSRIKTAQQLGWAESGRLDRSRRDPAGALLRFDVPRLKHPVYVRSRSTDADTFEACLMRRYYGLVPPDFPVRFVIDAGANAGYAAIYFLERYPEAQVAALEPDPENYAVALKNLQPFGARSVLLNMAIWPTSGFLRLERTGRYDSTRVSEAGGAADCAAIDPISLLTRCARERVDLFKCDIEGAEERLFSDHPDAWLERTNMLVIELHGARAHRIVYEATRRHGFRARVDHALHFFTRPSHSQA